MLSPLPESASMPTNDNEPKIPGTTPTPSDAHGQAALLLVESLLHGLCENSTLSAADAIEIVDRAVDVQFDQAEAADGAGASMWQSHSLLSAIAKSLSFDGNGGSPPPYSVA